MSTSKSSALRISLLLTLLTLLLTPPLPGQVNEAYIRQQALDSVCRVSCQFPDSTSYGTGVYLGGNVVLSANHITLDNQGRRAPSIYVEFKNRRVHVTKTVYDKTGSDSALLLLETDPQVPAQPLATTDPDVGTRVYMAGFDHGDPDSLRVFSGRVTLVTNSGNLIISSGASTGQSVSGNSGGPVWDIQGNVVANLWGGAPAGNPIRHQQGHIVEYTTTGETGAVSNGNLTKFLNRCADLVNCPPGGI